jgi:hypothetical protein
LEAAIKALCEIFGVVIKPQELKYLVLVSVTWAVSLLPSIQDWQPHSIGHVVATKNVGIGERVILK